MSTTQTIASASLYRLVTIHSADAHGGQLAAVACSEDGEPITYEIRKGAGAADPSYSHAGARRRFGPTRRVRVVDAHTGGVGGTYSCASWTALDEPAMTYADAMRRVGARENLGG